MFLNSESQIFQNWKWIHSVLPSIDPAGDTSGHLIRIFGPSNVAFLKAVALFLFPSNFWSHPDFPYKFPKNAFSTSATYYNQMERISRITDAIIINMKKRNIPDNDLRSKSTFSFYRFAIDLCLNTGTICYNSYKKNLSIWT